MGLFSKAKENFENRQKINDYNYRTKEYIQEGKIAYQDAYNDLRDACWDVQYKFREFVNFKQQVLTEINRTLKRVDQNHSDLKLSLDVNFPSVENSRVNVPSWEKLDCLNRIIDTWTVPSLMDFVRDVDISDVFEAKMNMDNARNYRDVMRAKRRELQNARNAIRSIPSFMREEKSKIRQLMEKFRKTADLIHSEKDKEQIDALLQISQLLADSLVTEFIDNNYQVTSQYQTIHNRMAELNSSLDNVSWLIEG